MTQALLTTQHPTVSPDTLCLPAGGSIANGEVRFCVKCNKPWLMLVPGWLVLLGLAGEPIARRKLQGPPTDVESCINCGFVNEWHARTSSPNDINKARRDAATANRDWRGIPTAAIKYPPPPASGSTRQISLLDSG
jgi:hypothetical protein